ncbi:sensor histidine kinase, partial [Clostridium butyricum]|uniref:sensor histidine kinase n=1 Tax=Clostridium butyricum TaxID=1492 RepID=UPI00374EEC7C
LCIFMFCHEYLRIFKVIPNIKYEYILMFFHICSAMIIHYYLKHASSIALIYCIIFDFFSYKKNILKFFLSIHAIFYFFITIIIHVNEDFTTIIMFITINFFAYSGITGMLYNQKKIEVEKEELEKLNIKLTVTNAKLFEYAANIEKITILNERSRVSQQLHDSLGHSLMALTMYLEFAEKISNTDTVKLKKVLYQSKQIVQSSITELRNTVTIMKSEPELYEFNTSIKNLINNFNLFNYKKIDYTINKSIDDLSNPIKISLYTTIQESITNSLKHGNATKIDIRILRNNDNLKVLLTNNGIVCNNIVKSNGLIGIDNRIKALGGTTNYFSNADCGFGINISIPI